MRSSTTVVRSMQHADIPALAEYWYDNMILLQQSQPQIMLSADAQARWMQAAEQWLDLDSEDMILLTAIANEISVTGCIIAEKKRNDPGCMPETIAIIQAFVLNMHTKQTKGGIGRILLKALREKLQDDGITQIQVSVPARLAVQQAFWRSNGSIHMFDTFWLSSGT